MTRVKFPADEFDPSGVHASPARLAAEQGEARSFARAWDHASGFGGWIDALPKMLARQTFARLQQAMRGARDRGIVWGVGAHVIKTGLAPVLIDLMARGYVSAIAMNGAGLIHDFEVALAGTTSEEVDATLGAGTFGMAAETGGDLNRLLAEGVARGLGLGQSLATHFDALISATSPDHVIGTDIPHDVGLG